MLQNFVVKKLVCSLHVTIDFRMVNKNIRNDAYPMHKVGKAWNHEWVFSFLGKIYLRAIILLSCLEFQRK